MAEYLERITTNGRDIDYKSPHPPVERQVEGDGKWVRKVNLFDSKYQPCSEGTPHAVVGPLSNRRGR